MEERRSRRARLGDAALAVSFGVLSLVAAANIAADGEERWNAFGVVLIIVVSGALMLRSIAPLATLAVIVAGLTVYTLADFKGGPVYLAALVPMYSLAATRGWRGAAKPVAVAIVVLAASGLTRADTTENLGYHIAFVGWSVAALFLGEATRNRREHLAALEQRARDLEETRDEEARRRVAEERLRIARDLHDVIAHGIATIHLQSGVAAHVLERHPEEIEPALLAIKRTSKEVLTELRATLDVLRGDEDAPLAPTPGLDRLDDLIEATRRAGVPVELHRAGNASRLPTAVDAAAYRIVQESLTNVMRHAVNARAEVSVVRDGGEVQIEVNDDGVGVPAYAADGVGPPGHGIVGMRERAEILGGRLDAGPRPGGGFRVRARLPVTIP